MYVPQKKDFDPYESADRNKPDPSDLSLHLELTNLSIFCRNLASETSRFLK